MTIFLSQKFGSYKEYGTSNDTEIEGFKAELKLMRSETFENKELEKKAVEFEITKIETRLNNLLNENFDGNLPEEIYKSKKGEYLNRIAELKEKRSALDSADGKIFNYYEEIGKLLKSPLNIYNLAKPEQKRNFMKSMVENFYWNGSNLDLVWKKPFNLIAERPIFHNGREDWTKLGVHKHKATTCAFSILVNNREMYM